MSITSSLCTAVIAVFVFASSIFSSAYYPLKTGFKSNTLSPNYELYIIAIYTYVLLNIYLLLSWLLLFSQYMFSTPKYSLMYYTGPTVSIWVFIALIFIVLGININSTISNLVTAINYSLFIGLCSYMTICVRAVQCLAIHTVFIFNLSNLRSSALISITALMWCLPVLANSRGALRIILVLLITWIQI